MIASRLDFFRERAGFVYQGSQQLIYSQLWIDKDIAFNINLVRVKINSCKMILNALNIEVLQKIIF